MCREFKQAGTILRIGGVGMMLLYADNKSFIGDSDVYEIQKNVGDRANDKLGGGGGACACVNVAQPLSCLEGRMCRAWKILLEL